MGFQDIWRASIFLKYAKKIQVPLKSGKNMYIYDKYLAELFFEWEMFQTEVVNKIRTCILYSATFSESFAIYGITWKNMVDPHRPHITVLHGLCALYAG